MYRDYGRVYKVFISFDKEVMNEEEVKSFTNDKFGGHIEIIELNGHELELLWTVPVNEGVHEIDISLYYTLNDSEIGTYTCEYVS